MCRVRTSRVLYCLDFLGFWIGLTRSRCQLALAAEHPTYEKPLHATRSNMVVRGVPQSIVLVLVLPQASK